MQKKDIGFQTKSKSKKCMCWLNGCYHSADKGLHCTKMKKEILNCIEKYRVLWTYWTTLVCSPSRLRSAYAFMQTDPKGTLCMKCNACFLAKIRKRIFQNDVCWKIIPSMLSKVISMQWYFLCRFPAYFLLHRIAHWRYQLLKSIFSNTFFFFFFLLNTDLYTFRNVIMNEILHCTDAY